LRIYSGDLIHNVLKNNRFAKILLVISFIFILLALIIIAGTPAADGYEVSIYGAYPGYFWIFLIVAIFSAILVILQEIFNNKKTNWWIIAFFAIFFIYISIISADNTKIINLSAFDIFSEYSQNYSQP